MKLRKNKKNSIIFRVIILVFITTLSMLGYFSKKIIPVIEYKVERMLNNEIYDYIYNTFSRELMVKKELFDLISITKNKNDEILSIDYNFNIAYGYLKDNLDILYDNVKNISLSNEMFNDNENIFMFPLGIVSNNYWFYSFGPKVPCKVDLLSDIKMFFKTKVSNYGINNVLVELYLVIETKNSMFISLYYEDFGESYEIVLASKLITGIVPNYYGGIIEKSSSIISS